MTVLKISKLISLAEEVGKADIGEAIRNPEGLMGDLEEIANIIQPLSEKAQKMIVDRMGEERFCELEHAIQNHVMTAMTTNGYGMGLLRSHLSGDLKGYSDTFFFAILGLLMNDEVI